MAIVEVDRRDRDAHEAVVAGLKRNSDQAM